MKATFDVGALERYLNGAIAGFRGPLTVAHLGGGQSNPTFLLKGGNRTCSAQSLERSAPPDC